MTPERWKRLNQVLSRRQPDLTVLMDNVHKPHNLSAVLRSCDAVGVFSAHAVWPNPRVRPSMGISSGSGKWVPVQTHDSVRAAADHLHAEGFQIIAANLSADAVDFREVDYTRPTAVLLGAELTGVSDEARSVADHDIIIPMVGMVESLNVSVAAATVLYEAQRQRVGHGLYDQSRIPADDYARILFEWGHPKVAKYCQERGLPYPAVDEDGEISGPLPQSAD